MRTIGTEEHFVSDEVVTACHRSRVRHPRRWLAPQRLHHGRRVDSHRYLRWAIEVVDGERILFATDYPPRAGPDGVVEQFLHAAGLDRADQERSAAGNWDALVAGIRR